jgi:hypothetical protein
MGGERRRRLVDREMSVVDVLEAIRRVGAQM